MKIVVFGLTLSSSWGNGHATPYRAIMRALHNRGADITFYEKDVEYYRWRRDFTECDYCNLVLYPDWNTIRESALRNCADADVVITASYVPEGARISDEVLEMERPLRVFYDLDTPITLQGLRSGDLEYVRKDQVREFDLYLSFTGGPVLHELADMYGAELVRPLYGCVDPDVHQRVASRPEYACDLSYMGTYAPDRQSRVDELFLQVARERHDATFLLAGSMYPREWTWPPNVRRVEHVAPSQHPALYSSSRVTLNITRKEMAANGYCPSGRFFEAAACGTPIVSDYFDGLEQFFDLTEEVLVVRSAGDVMNAMSLGDSELQKLAQNARERTLSSHTGECRANEVVKFFDEAWSRSPHTIANRNTPENMFGAAS